MELEREQNCPEVLDGVRCRKYRTRMPEGDWIHGGGHVFISEKNSDRLENHHYDAGALLKGESVDTHAPKDCPGDNTCWNVRMGLD